MKSASYERASLGGWEVRGQLSERALPWCRPRVGFNPKHHKKKIQGQRLSLFLRLSEVVGAVDLIEAEDGVPGT